MQKLRLHCELYSAEAIAQSMAVFADVAELELRQDMPYFEVELESQDPDAEQGILGELGNYALAMTVEEKRAGAE